MVAVNDVLIDPSRHGGLNAPEGKYKNLVKNMKASIFIYINENFLNKNFSWCDDGLSRVIARCCAGRSRCNCGRYVKKETPIFNKISGRSSIKQIDAVAIHSRSVLSDFLLITNSVIATNLTTAKFDDPLQKFGSKFYPPQPGRFQLHFRVFTLLSGLWGGLVGAVVQGLNIPARVGVVPIRHAVRV